MSLCRITSAALLWAASCAPMNAKISIRPDVPVGHISERSFGDWVATGTAFQYGPARTDQLPKLEIRNAVTSHVISSEIRDDGPTGTLVSPPFVLERDYVAFRIGGGDQEYSTCLNLLVDGKVVRSATGRNSDALRPESWDVREWKGRTAQVMAVDESRGDWGHVNVDGVVQTDLPEARPFSAGAPYQEKLRPQFHFTARQWAMARPEPHERQEGWVNDLNGLTYYDGEWHLFAQRWAKCWLHAVSRDLVHWTELPPAFWEESEGSGVQSGTIVVDYPNSSGLAKDASNPAMVAFWSRFDNRSFCVTYSLDHGRTWQLYPGNPIFVAPERDPKVFWYAPGKHWVMIYYGDGAYRIRTSADLLHWEQGGPPIADSFECPDLFELPLDGDPSKKKWVLIQGNGNYSYGTFDGKAFREESGRRPCDAGPNFYATQSWSNTETGDGRRIQCAWMRGATFPGMPFSQEVSFPCELSLKTTAKGVRLFRKPIAEIEALQNGKLALGNVTLTPGRAVPLTVSGDLYRIVADVDVPAGAELKFGLRGDSVTLTSTELRSGRSDPVKLEVPPRHVEILLDRGSVETFLNDGEVSHTRYALPREDGITIESKGGTCLVRSIQAFPLKSAWGK